MEYDLGHFGKCKIKKHRRAKRMTLVVGRSGAVSLTIPYWLSYAKGTSLIESNLQWIKKKIFVAKKRPQKSMLDFGSKKDYKLHKKNAKDLIRKKLDYYCKIYDCKYKRISIRNQRTRWGSCSELGNLNFNYRVVFLPENLLDYLVVHELCHLSEMNHSKRFWTLVGKAIPNFKILSRKLRKA